VSPVVGYGVFATALIRAGTITYVQDSLDIIVPRESPLLKDARYREMIHRYSVVEPDGSRVLCWDLAKYVNHCCHANTMTTGWGFEIALRDIPPGDEIRDEYGLFNLDDGMPLHCHFPDCRVILRREDAVQLADRWDYLIQQALLRLETVPQPLLTYLPQETLAEVRAYLHSGAGYRSVRWMQSAEPGD
jgi:hypothetical protein